MAYWQTQDTLDDFVLLFQCFFRYYLGQIPKLEQMDTRIGGKEK